jgi:ATP-dependent helicase/nuclease subunit B
VAEGRGPSVFSIPVHRAFADALATGLLAQFGTDRVALARGLVLVPNNRAGQALSDAFVRKAAGGLLLPRLVAIGDPELDERTGAMLDPAESAPIPPAIDPLRRQFLLARLVQQQRGGINGAEAMRLAGDLGRVLDQLHIEQIAPSRLKEVDVGALSGHWQTSLGQLSVVLDRWPEVLEQAGAIDLADRRNRQLKAVAERWREAPPASFVIAAGISTTAPAIAALLRVVAAMPDGQVVLAGLDQAMPDDEWDVVAAGEDTHPQHHLAQLLDRMGVARGEVQRWRWGSDHDARVSRAQALSNAMAPALFTQKWSAKGSQAAAFAGVHCLELSTPAEEAQAIAIALREALESEGRTAALVTPDRDLARRVSALLERWGIIADDSAGRPLSATLPGTLLLGLAEALTDGFAPATLLALLKHPLVTGESERLAWLDQVRDLDLALRGPRPAAGLAGVTAFLAEGDERTRPVREQAQPGWAVIAVLLAPIAEGFDQAKDLAAMLAVLRDGLTSLAGEKVWSRRDGRMLADLIAEAEGHAASGPELLRHEALPTLLRQLLDQLPVRPAQGGHPRIAIWGLIEARLQSAELMILGGLNEGVWPSLAAPDPWLAPAIRRQLGLPGLERRIGREAHDLASAMGAAEVLVTRARRDARSPAIASRFWLRLETFTGGLAPPKQRHDVLARALDGHPGVPQRSGQPAPAPPLADRPRSISVTEVDGLNADPFAFYARKMLKLAKLGAVDADPDAAWRGSLIHGALEDWAKLDDYAPDALSVRIEAALAMPGIHPLIRALWQPRLIEAAAWIANATAEDRTEGRTPLAAECKGTIEFAGVKLHGRADRIDRIAPDGLAVVDYKTGAPPSDAQVKGGFALQLGLIALIAERGGFEGVAGTAQAFEYWSLARENSGGRFGYRRSPTSGRGQNKSDPESFVDETAAKFAAAAARWLTGDAPFTAKLHPEYAWADYDHLMRLEEWQGRNG